MDKLIANNIFKQNDKFTLDIEKLVIFKNAINLIYGENGAGKTTLLNFILENSNAFTGYKKTLLTQTSYTFNRSCVKNVEMVLKWNNSNVTALELLDIVGLADRKEHIGKKLSGGEKKRLAFAMALATNSDIILLDEPFANVDLKNQKKLLEIITNLIGQKTIIIVSHRLDILKDVSQNIIYLEDGRLNES